jgi:hypothetical protein
MPLIVSVIIAALVGLLLAIGGGVALASSQGGAGTFPTQVPGDIAVYGATG